MGLGNVFGGTLGQVLQGALPTVGGIVGGFFGPAGLAIGGAAGTAAAGLLTGFDQPGGAAGAPNVPPGSQGPIEEVTGVAPFLPSPIDWSAVPAPLFMPDPRITPAMAVPAVAGGAVALAGMTARLGQALLRVAGRFGLSIVSFAGLSRFGGRLWRSITSFARRHPNISSIGLLTSLGFAADEAAEFLAWGTIRRRRRRGGGISGRDIRITRRTLRRLASVRDRVGGFTSRRTRRSMGRSDSVTIARAG